MLTKAKCAHQKITFIGNKGIHRFGTDQDIITLRHAGLVLPGTARPISIPSKNLSGGLETLKSFYQNPRLCRDECGFDPDLDYTSDKKDIYITVNLTEGEKYTVTDIRLEGETFGRDAEILQSLISLKSGETYSAAKLTESTKRITDRMGNFGYAFANVNANPDVDRERRKLPSPSWSTRTTRVYVRRINVAGNTRTRDEVIRREFRQYEASWYDGEKDQALARPRRPPGLFQGSNS